MQETSWRKINLFFWGDKMKNVLVSILIGALIFFGSLGLVILTELYPVVSLGLEHMILIFVIVAILALTFSKLTETHDAYDVESW